MSAASARLRVLAQKRAALDDRERAQVVRVEVQEIERVEARSRAPLTAQKRVKVRQALRAVRDGFAVQDDPRGREGHHSGPDRDEGPGRRRMAARAEA